MEGLSDLRVRVVVVQDDLMIAREFLNLIEFPEPRHRKPFH